MRLSASLSLVRWADATFNNIPRRIETPMVYFRFLIALAIGSVSSLAQGDVINVNIFAPAFGPNPNATLNGTAATAPFAFTGTTWNDLSLPNAVGLLNSDGLATGVNVSFADGGNPQGDFTFSQSTGLTAGVDDILDNYLAVNNGFGGAVADTTISFSGLDDSLVYDLSFVSVGDTAGQGGSFTIDGTTLTTTGTSVTGPLVAGDNFVSFFGLSSSGGLLDVTFNTGPDNSAFAVLNGFQLSSSSAVAVPEPGSFAAILFLAVAASGRRRVWASLGKGAKNDDMPITKLLSRNPNLRKSGRASKFENRSTRRTKNSLHQPVSCISWRHPSFSGNSQNN
ncbi:MAG: hypothetical protein ABJZ55_01200 [Fuerstiella sp.]